MSMFPVWYVCKAQTNQFSTDYIKCAETAKDLPVGEEFIILRTNVPTNERTFDTNILLHTIYKHLWSK